MKAIVVIFTILGLAACSDGASTAKAIFSKPSTPEQVAGAYVQSVIDHDQSSITSLYGPDSQLTQTFWPGYSNQFQRIQEQHKNSKISFRVLRCQELEHGAKTVCLVRPTRDDTDLNLTFAVHVKDLHITSIAVGDGSMK